MNRMINRKAVCPVCGNRGMVLAQSNHRPFYGCELFPGCPGRRFVHYNGKPFTDQEQGVEAKVQEAIKQHETVNNL